MHKILTLLLLTTVPLGARAAGLAQEALNGVTQAGDELGAALARGDFDGNGLDDLIIGAPGEDNDAGAIFVLAGAQGAGLTTGFPIKQSATGASNTPGDRFGHAVAVGDFDHDGRDDVVVSAPGEDSDAGIIYYWRGTAQGIVPTQGVWFFASDFGCGAKQAGDEFGWALAAGDFNADGYDDLAVGAPGENADEGRVCVIKGRATVGLAAGGGAYYAQSTGGLGQAEPGDRFGAALVAGRFSPDTRDDLAVGAPNEVYNGVSSGVVTVYYGAGGAGTAASAFFASGTLLTPLTAGDVLAAGSAFGATLAAGRISGTACADLVVGAPGQDAGAGAVYFFPGNEGGLSAPPPKTLPRVYRQSGHVSRAVSEPGDELGRALAVGDLDGNGVFDLVVGAPGEAPEGGPADAGLIVEYYGSVGGLDQGDYRLQDDGAAPSELGDRFGAALAAGDFDGDGRDEVVVGAPGEAPGALPAGGYVFIVERGAVRLTHGPILGGVSNSRIKIWARGNKACALDVTRKAPGGSTVLVNGPVLNAALDFTGAVSLTGLVADTEYAYTVRLCGQTVYSGSFRTLPSPSTGGVVRFAYGADIKPGADFRPYRSLDEVRLADPMFVILGGDNIYADSTPVIDPTLTGYRHRYRETFGEGMFRELARAVPTFMMWDDHEIWNDFYPGDPEHGAYYADARQAFVEYQGSHNPAPAVANRLYYSFRAGQVDFFVLDARSHRVLSGPNKSMLGTEQRDALLAWLSTATGKFKFIVSSVPFDDLNTTNGDSWKGFTAERQLIYDYIHDHGIDDVVFLSGDQHWSAVYRRDQTPAYARYEFMPSPLATTLRDPEDPTPHTPQDLQHIVYEDNSTTGFGYFEINTAVSPATLNYSWISSAGVVLYALALDADDVGL